MRIVTLLSPTFRATIDGVAVHDAEGLRREIADADVLVLAPRYGEIVHDVWPLPARLKWIHALGAGVETLPFELLRETDVIVTNSRGVYSDALAEFATAAMFWFAKRLGDLARRQATKTWQPVESARLEGSTAGIVGYGSIGRAVAERATALRMHVLSSGRRSGTPLDEMLPKADYVILSTPLTSETRHLIDASRIARMKPSAILINISRGATVDEPALIAALQSSRIAGAALDVFEIEPLPPTSPLWSLENVLISPHSADQTADSHERAAALFLRNLARFREGRPLENVVDKSAGY